MRGRSQSRPNMRSIVPTSRRMAATVAWALRTITFAVAPMATVGFAALNIADTTAARASTVTERAELSAWIEQLRSERGGITEEPIGRGDRGRAAARSAKRGNGR